MTSPVAPSPAGQLPSGVVNTDRTHPRFDSTHRAILALLAAGAFITSLDSAIVSLTLPAIARAFDVPTGGGIEWVSIAYMVAVAALLISIGRLCDMVSRGPLWLAGLAVFTVGSILCAISPALDLLIFARVIQGIGGAFIVATGVSILGGAFPEGERGRALGVIGLASAASSCLGPILGGTISDHLHWRVIFLINVPICLATLWFGRRYLPLARPAAHQQFDLLGSILIGVGISGTIVTLWYAQSWGWSSPRFLSAAVVIAAVLIAARFTERRATLPLVDLAIFRVESFSPALSRLMLSRLALMAPSFLLPFYLIQLRGFSGQFAGLLLAPFPVAVMVASPVSGFLADRFRPRWLEVAGLALIAASLISLARLDATSSTLQIVFPLIVIGLGQGLFTAPNCKAILDAAPATEEGQASGLLSASRVIGQSLSIALASGIFAAIGSGAAGHLLDGSSSTMSTSELEHLQRIFLAGYQAALFLSALFAILGAAVIATQAAHQVAARSPALRRGADRITTPLLRRPRPHPTET